MSLRFSCSSCGSKLLAKAELAGRRGKCPKCGQAIQVPNAADSPVAMQTKSPAFGRKTESGDDCPVTVRDNIEKLRDSQDAVRHRAALELRDLRNSHAVEPLIAALKDECMKTRCRAAEALGEIGNSEAVAALITAVQGGDAELRLIAAEALEKIGDTNGLDAAASAFRDKSTRLNAEWETFDNNKGSSSFGWDPGDFVHRTMYRRGLRMLHDPGVTRLPMDCRVALWWYVGRLGLLAGIPLSECLTHFEKGISLSPPHDHMIVRDHHLLKYALAVLAKDYRGATALRQQVEYKQTPFHTYYIDFDSSLSQLVRAASMPKEVQEFQPARASVPKAAVAQEPKMDRSTSVDKNPQAIDMRGCPLDS